MCSMITEQKGEHEEIELIVSHYLEATAHSPRIWILF